MTEERLRAVPSLESSGRLRFFSIFLLYVGQGIPIGLFDFALPAWMAVNGASAQDIGFVIAMVGIPWSFKFVAGFIMDRYTLLEMGRRRAWIIGAQASMILFLLIFAAIDPGPRDILILGLIALAVNTATVFQDVAVDGLTVDIVPEEDRSMAGALASGGQVIGVAISAAFTGAMVYAFGASAAYAACAALVAVVTIHIVWVRERVCERRLPWSAGRAHAANLATQARGWLPLARAALANTLSPLCLAWCPVLIIRGLTYGICVIAVPLIATAYTGWTEDRIGSLNGTAQLVAGIATIAIGSFLVARFGAQRALILSFLASTVLVLWMGVSAEKWSEPAIITVFVFSWVMIYYLGGIGEVMIIMRLSPPAIPATQYSVFMAFHNMGISLAGILVSSIAVLAEPEAMLMLLAGAQALAAVLLLAIRFPTIRIGAALAVEPTVPAMAAARD